MLISLITSCSLFVIGILFILFERDELAIVANTIGLVITLIALSKKKGKGHKSAKQGTINSTKVVLNALTQKNFNDINFKILEKENNPYTKDLKVLCEAMQKQQNRIQKRTKKLHEKNMQNIQLLSTISHEIKNPLSVIQASIETILMQPQIDSNMRDKLLNRIMIYSKKINALLNKLTLSQSLEHSVIAVKMETFNLWNLCEEVIDGFKNYLLKTIYSDKKVILEGESREVYADRILIEQVLNNLIYNALKYAKSQVIVRIKLQYFEVIDDGNGVDKNEINNLTKKFYQGQGAKKNEHSLGLGLFIVKEIAKIHNTKVEFFSRQNKKEGLCVRFFV